MDDSGLFIIDGHCDSIGDYVGGKRDLFDDRNKAPRGHWDLKRARMGRVGLQFFASYIEEEYKPYMATRRGLELLAASHEFIRKNAKLVRPVLDRGDLRELDGSRVGILLSVEGGEILGEDLFMVDVCFLLGVRAMGLTWNQRNALGCGVGEGELGGSLSRFGVRVVERMNALGMLVDVSHLHEKGFWQVLEVSKGPVAATHSCAQALCDHPRNLTDEQLRALAAAGGVVGVNFYPEFLVQDGEARLVDVVRHIEHIAEVAGVGCVGLGSDFDGVDALPQGLEGADCLPALLVALGEAGFNNKEVADIAWGNFWRVLDQTLPSSPFRGEEGKA
ncbi:MAG: dipeptidase [Gracilibacteraceae bacterium]|jgi:membrane dipeptidase|nr:dipeptidase [Gracilibacteraceae bacterium]